MIFLTADLTPFALFYHREPSDFARRLLERAEQRRRAGELREAELYAHQARQHSHEARAYIDQAASLVLLSDIYREMGKLGPALRSAREAYEVLQRQPGLDQRHNEAVAAYNLGLIHHLLGNDVEALNWYQNARQMLDLAREHWAAQKELSLMNACQRLSRWVAELSESLSHEEGRGGLQFSLILPARLMGSKDGQLSVAKLKLDGLLPEPNLRIGDRTFELHPFPGKPAVVHPGESYLIFEVPEQIGSRFGARRGDCILARRVSDWGTGGGYYLLNGAAGLDAGQFHRDGTGKVFFQSLITGRVIGGIEGGDFSVYDPLALLRPIG